MKLVAIILVFNEERHLSRCIQSLQGVADEVIVVDCFSSDATHSIAEALGARVLQRGWKNYADQFNWAIGQLGDDVDWILRIDADEVLSPALVLEIRERLPELPGDVAGVRVNRWMTFQGRLIRHGGVFPAKMLRIFRRGSGECENRWMDEHIKVAGREVDFAGDMVDDNLNSLTWWTDKHNRYASREAVDLLNLEFGFMPHDSVASLRAGGQAGAKRWLKENVYVRLPTGIRAFLYFAYRYFLRAGFLDGAAGTSFHFLQGFWYRYLVDVKVEEVRRFMAERNVGVKDAIDHVLGIKV